MLYLYRQFGYKTPDVPEIELDEIRGFIKVKNSFNIKDELKVIGAKYDGGAKAWQFKVKDDVEVYDTIKKIAAIPEADIIFSVQGWDMRDIREFATKTGAAFLVCETGGKWRLENDIEKFLTAPEQIYSAR